MRESVGSLEKRIEELRRMPTYPARELGTEDIPGARYTSEAYFRLEQERVFRGPVWLLAGRESRIAKPGDYFTFETGLGGSIIVVRNREGQAVALEVFSHELY